MLRRKLPTPWFTRKMICVLLLSLAAGFIGWRTQAGHRLVNLKAASPDSAAAKRTPHAASPVREAIARKLQTQAKVNVELFVMSQCPFGARAEEAMAPVLAEFGEQVDFQLRFIASPTGDGFASLHGQPEVEEDIRQTVMAEQFPAQFFDYVVARAANYRSTEWQPVAAAAGLDVVTVDRLARSEDGKRLFAENIRRSNELRIMDSPTILLDGEKYDGKVLPPAPRADAALNGFNPNGAGSLSMLAKAFGWALNLTAAQQSCTPGTVCRASAGFCDLAETCRPDGTCPPDVFVSAGTTCRGSAGVCDVSEYCTGASAQCPADTFWSPSVICRGSSGACDPAEFCTGSSAACPADVACCTNPVVTTTNDSGTGSLRQVIADACPGSTITFANGINLITLTSGELVINKNLTIQGPGANLLTVQRSTAQGTPNFRIFNVGSGATATIDALTVANGKAAGSLEEKGGGLYNLGSVTITNCVFSGNAASGDAISRGGGIANDGTMTIAASTFSGNVANTASNCDGGGIYNQGTMTVTNSTLNGNTAGSHGGGIYNNNGGPLTLTNCTISGNAASGGFRTQGGGLYNFIGSTSSRNTIIAGNSAGAGPDVYGTLTSQGYNLIGNTGNATITGDTTGNLLGQNPLLGPLASNGGPTQTHALLPGSPAINAGDNCVLTANGCGNNNLALSTDQRGAGFPRKVGGAVDIGAFESQLIASAGGPYTISEGGGLTLTGSPNDNALTYSWDVNGDGTFGDATGQNPTLTWSQLMALGINDGPAVFNNVKVRVSDGVNPAVDSAATSLTVNNTAPTITSVSGLYVALEGNSFPTTVNFSDPAGANDTYTLTINWGDGNTSVIPNAVSGQQHTHTYADGNISFTQSIYVTDSDNAASTTFSRTIDVVNTAPGISSVSVPATAQEGSTVTVSATFFDAGGLNDTYTMTIQWGDGTTSVYNNVSFTQSYTHVYADGPKTAQLYFQVNDEDTTNNRSSFAPATLNVLNVAPTLTLSGAATTGLGATYTLNLAANDPGSDTISGWTINWGDGTAPQTVTGNPSNVTHSYLASGNFTISATATDEDGTYAAGNTVGVTVNKADTTTTITNAAALSSTPSLQYQAYLVQWSVAVNPPGSGTPTGTVTVSDGTDSCMAAVAMGQCTLISTTAGLKTITVTYAGDDNFNGESETTSHQVTACTNNPLVMNGNDIGAGSLREAIAIACPGSTITFANGVNLITLTSGELVINKNLTLQGPGANLLSVSGNELSRVFNIASGATVTLTGLKIEKGKIDGGSSSAPNLGGGIYNAGTLTLLNCVLAGNSITGGTGRNQGGGIANFFGTLYLTNCLLVDNSVSGTVNNQGGGIFNGGGTAKLTNSTLTNNSVSGNSNTLVEGGGIYNTNSLELTNCTLAGNFANNGDGGGINNNALGTVKAKATIIAGNTVTGTFAQGPDVYGRFNSQGNNLIGSNSDSFGFTNGVSQDKVGLAPQLSLLGNYGGPTQTLRPLPGSPAIDAGNNCVLTANGCGDNNEALTTDQRGAGFNRQVGSQVDIGAFEANYSLAATGGTPQSTTVNTAFANPLVATLTESSNPVSDVLLTFTAPGSGASATFPNGNTATTNASGIASVTATANLTPGSYQVTASVNGLTPASFNLSNTCPTINATVSGGGTICPTGTAQVFVNVSGGTAPYTVTLTNGGGQQTGAGPFTFNVSPASTTTFSVQSATDANGCPVMATGSALVTVNPATAINAPPVSQTRTVGQSVTFSVGATGTNLGYQWRKNEQPILNATQSSLTINAVALADQGSYDVVVTGTCGMLTSLPATLTVTCPTITLGGLPQAAAGTLFNTSLSASPEGGNFQFTSSDKPAWLTLAANGALSGTPTAVGTFSFNVNVSGFSGACGQNIPVSVTVVCPTITLTPANLPNAEAGTLYNQQLTASPAGGSYTFSLASGLLPSGITLSATGLLSGTTTQTGTFNFRVSVAGFAGQCTTFRDYVLVVSGCAPVTITPTTLSNGTVGTGYSQNLSATPSGAYNFSVSSGALPPGLMLNAANGSLSGTPTTAGTFNFRITATSGSCSGARDYSVTINCATLTLGALPNATAGNAYNQTVSVTPTGNYNFSVVQGNLPPGLTLNPSTGAVSGTPILAGTHNFTIKAQTAGGCSGQQAYSLTVNCPNLTLSSLSTPTLNSPYNQTVTASPAGGNYSFAVAGVLPSGLSLNPATGAISGTPTAGGAYNFTITATGFGTCTGSRQYTGTIGNGSCPTVTLPELPGGQPGQLYNQSLAAAPSGTYSYAVTSGSLPPGLTLYGSFGMLFGYPATTGTFNFTITATGNNNCTGSKNYALAISGGALALPTFGDFDGDGKADLSVWRGTSGEWLTVTSGDGQLKTETWGSPAAPYFDVMTPGDYDGDGKMDLAVFRRSTGQWLIKGSRDGAVTAQVWGVGTDVPVPGDYDGDGKTDLAVWRGAESNWYIQRSSDGQTETVSWGTSRAPYRDLPVPADYDGDGKTDIAIFRQQNGHWYIRLSSDGSTLDKVWGLGSDVPVAADYDGDGKADIAVWRGADANWYILRSSDGVVQSLSWGSSTFGDVPAPGDYDGDGKADAAVWRASEGNWYVRQSSNNTTRTRNHGQPGDTPVTLKARP